MCIILFKDIKIKYTTTNIFYLLRLSFEKAPLYIFVDINTLYHASKKYINMCMLFIHLMICFGIFIHKIDSVRCGSCTITDVPRSKLIHFDDAILVLYYEFLCKELSGVTCKYNG